MWTNSMCYSDNARSRNYYKVLLITISFLGRSRCTSNQERGSNDQTYEAGKWPQHPRLWQTQKSR